MQYKFTLKNLGGFLRTAPILLVLFCLFAGTSSAQCTWTASTAYPAPILDAPAASVGTSLYTFAGVSNGAVVAASNKFDGTTWTAIAALPAAVEFASAVSDGTNIFIMGGALVGSGAPQTTNYRYNVATNTYTTLAPSSVGTWSHTAVFLNGKIYKIGGIGAAPVTAVEIYDIALNTWTAGAAYPIASGFVSAVSIGGFIYAAGGIDAAGTVKTYRYDPVANTWNDAAIADLPASRWGAAHAEYRGGFVLAGGYVGGDVATNISTSVISWDPVSNSWSALSSMLFGKSRFAGAILNDNFYVIGGRSTASSGFVGTTDVQKLTCPPILDCVGTPTPGNTFATASVVCPGTPVTLTAQNATPGNLVSYQWQTAPAATGPWTTAPGTATNASYTFSPTVTAFYRLQVTCSTNPAATSTPVQITVTPCTCLTPDAASICEGAIQRLAVTGAGIPGSVTASSGAITVNVPDANATGASSTLPVTLPAGASITSIAVNFNLTHTWDADMVFNLVSPNGKVINLVNGVGGNGDNFTNTTINIPGGGAIPSITTGAAPFTGNWTFQGATAVGPTAYTSNVTTFAAFNIPDVASGAQTWRLAMRDVAGGDLGILTSWSITINYNVLPTAIWTGGTIFSEPTATTPYVAGTQANAVWVQPAATTTYTATIASGPCAGPNDVIVTVKPRPVVTVNPASGCGPLTITASGAATYAWSPSLGLSATTGATVIANPAATTIYSVTGTGANGCVGLPVTATVNSAPTASVISAVAGSIFQMQEGFTTVLPTGWARQNLSNPLATATPFNNWTQGDALLFPAFNGPTNSYALGNFQATTGTGTISNWLFTPVLNIKNGDQISFYTRTTTGATFPDRLEVRMSTNGASVNVGTTETSVGDYTTLLLTVNPNLVAGPGTGIGTSGYPDTWTRLTATITGVTGTVSGRFAFRHFVTNGGPSGANSDNIGLDQVEYSTPATTLCANNVTNIKVDITGGVGPFTVVFSNGTTNTTIANYTSGSNIQVSPSVTTTYTIVSVTGANGCVGTGISGAALVTITPPPAITTAPVNKSVCAGNNTTFTVVATPSTGNTYQWQVSTDGGLTYTNITNTGFYTGATTTTLTITGATVALNGYRYRVIITGACPPAVVTSAAATLSVNTPAVITVQPVNASICAGTSLTGTTATYSVTATGGGLTYQWQVSTDNGTTFTNIAAANANYSGATTSTLTVLNVTAAFATNVYRVNVTSGGCTAVSSATVTLTVNPTPVLVVSASPFTALYPGQTTTLAVAVSPNPGATYTWFKNGVAVPGATGNTLAGLSVDDLGSYTVRVTNVNGCTALSAATVISSSANDLLFIYPSPNTGQFQVRYYNALGSSPFTRTINVYDNKGTRVYTKVYSITSPYTRMDVDLKNHAKGIYNVELIDYRGNRMKTGRVLVL